MPTPQQFKKDVQELREKGFDQQYIAEILSDKYGVEIKKSRVNMCIYRNKFKRGVLKAKYVK